MAEALPAVAAGAQAGLDLPAPGADAGAARRFAAGSLSSLQRRADDGRPEAEAVFSLLGTDAAGAAEAFAALWSAQAGADAAGGGLYGLAASADAEGQTGDAVTILAVLAGAGGPQHDALLGLAVIAARQGRMAEAFDLAGACLEAEDRHPRACSIAGICELERGNKAAAQAALAAASRIARRRPEHARELQIAQRALLLMHLG